MATKKAARKISTKNTTDFVVKKAEALIKKEETKDKSPWYFLKNSAGKKDGAWTLLLVSFLVITFAYLMSLVSSLSYKDFAIEMDDFDPGYAQITFVALCGLYFSRKWTDTKYLANGNQESEYSNEEASG